MPAREKPDSVEWMRQRWLENQAPRPEHFAAMASLLRTTIVMTEEIDRVLKQSQLSRTGYLILITLQMPRDQSWPSDQSWPLGQLGKALLVHPTTITMAVDQLEKARLVQRTPHPSDRRTILARLTPDGHQAAEQATLALAGVGYGLADISETTARRITADLRKVRQAAGDLG
jgi:DNA-binding MarR family transcriptional regulator